MVPMHLGLIDRPFVPHNLVSAQESPFPLPKCQIAPRLKILMPSRSKKGTQIYCPFLSKDPTSESPTGSPVGSPYGERCLYPEPFVPILQGTQQGSSPSSFPSQSSHKEKHPTSRGPFSHLSKSPVDEPTPGCSTEPQ